MPIRFYQITVICFWLSTATWLVSTKLIPALRRGNPPNHHAASVAKLAGIPPVIWDMKWNFHPVGWAANKIIKNHSGQIEVLSRLQFTDWPKSESTSSSWLSKQLTELGNQRGGFQLKLTNRSVLDEDYQLKFIQSIITLGGDDLSHTIPWIRIQGDVNGDELELAFYLGERPLGKRTIPIRANCLVSSEISPYGFMPRLRMHQQWTTYQINPLRPPLSPQPPIVAKVERFEPLIWKNQLTDTFLIVYRKDEGSGTRASEDYLGRLWVKPEDGMVLQQEIMMLGSRVTLVRRDSNIHDELRTQLEQDWHASCDPIDLGRGAHPNHDGTPRP